MEGNGGEGAAAEGPRRSPQGGGAIVSYVTPKYSPGDAANGRACLQGSRGPKGLQGSRLAEAGQRCPQAAHEQGAYSLACSACPTYMQLTVAAGQPGPSSAAMPDEPDDDGGWGEEGASDSNSDTE